MGRAGDQNNRRDADGLSQIIGLHQLARFTTDGKTAVEQICNASQHASSDWENKGICVAFKCSSSGQLFPKKCVCGVCLSASLYLSPLISSSCHLISPLFPFSLRIALVFTKSPSRTTSRRLAYLYSSALSVDCLFTQVSSSSSFLLFLEFHSFFISFYCSSLPYTYFTIRVGVLSLSFSTFHLTHSHPFPPHQPGFVPR